MRAQTTTPDPIDGAEPEARTAMGLPPGVTPEAFSDPSGPLSVYLRNLVGTTPMTRDQEFVLAIRIGELRRTLWRAILSYPSFVAGICVLAREVLRDVDCPTPLLETMTVAARQLRDRDLQHHRGAYTAAREPLSVAMAESDLDGRVMDRVLADLTSIEGGASVQLNMKVKLPPRGSLPFVSYVADVKANYQALWSARNEFVRANLRLVVVIARRYSLGRMPLQDLIQEGNLGLMKAVDRFDPRKGFRFSTYGTWWIRHAVTRAIADKGRTVRLPVHMIDAYSKVQRARRQFAAQHGRNASEPELAAASGVGLERIVRMKFSLLAAPISFDQRLSLGADMTLLDTMEDPSEIPAPELLDNALYLQHLKKGFARLTPCEADILRRRVGLDDSPEMTLKEIGEQYGLSRERIRQMQEQALRKLREVFREHSLM